MLIAIFAGFVWYLANYEAGDGYFLRAIMTGWVSCYFGGGFAFAIALRMVGKSPWGLYLLVGVILVTKFADAGAYFSGRFFGRTKLCPAISPGKTLEGLLGGMMIASLSGWIYFGIFGRWVFGEEIQASFPGMIILGVVLTLAGLTGDLLVSIFKRETGCKDSGNLLPGLGGLWDVSDSLLPAFIAAYLLVMAGCVIGPGQ
jgi:phosphatidate cytidylyltransferase